MKTLSAISNTFDGYKVYTDNENVHYYIRDNAVFTDRKCGDTVDAHIYLEYDNVIEVTSFTGDYEIANHSAKFTVETAKEYAEEASKDTNPYRGGNYCGDVSKTDWLAYSVFTLSTYAFNVGSVLDESNHETILALLAEVDGEYWANEYIASWLTPFYRVTVYPYGQNFDKPFNYALIALCKSITERLDSYPVLDDDDYSQREYDAFINDVDTLARGDDNIINAIMAAYSDSNGEYESFLDQMYNVADLEEWLTENGYMK